MTKNRAQIEQRVIAYVAALTIAMASIAAGCTLYYGDDKEDREEREDKPDDSGHCSAPEEDFARSELPMAAVTADPPPPPISGGTLGITPDQGTAVVADPDRDQIYIASIAQSALAATIALRPGDEPGRVAFRGPDTAFVALRRGGAIAVVDLSMGVLAGRFEVCPAPRGVAFDPATDSLYAACHGGEFLRLDPVTGAILAETHLEPDLRDVLVDDSHVYVTVFRKAELLVLDREGQLQERMSPPVLYSEIFNWPDAGTSGVRFEPGVAWRTVLNPAGGVFMLHQRARKGPLPLSRGGYGGNECERIPVHATITALNPGQETLTGATLGQAVLPVDLALLSDAKHAVLVASGTAGFDLDFRRAVTRLPIDRDHEPFDCLLGDRIPALEDHPRQRPDGPPIAVATTNEGQVVLLFREPAVLWIEPLGPSDAPKTIPLSPASRHDSGHFLFHIGGGGHIACASCHPEGAEDGQVWEFTCIGPRRTQAVNIGIVGTEPLHWGGDMDKFDTLVSEVFVERMNGRILSSELIQSMAYWLDAQRPPPRTWPDDTSAVERGKRLFADPVVACATCHSGPRLTDNQSHDVGTGGKFQTPSLVGVGQRAPFMHTGCAQDLAERFSNLPCGGGDQHGVTSHLTGAHIDELVAYMKTL